MSNPPSRRVTLNDVARRSGVSYQTVSRVINNHPYVAEETRTRVLKVIDDLGYHPNKAAKSLVTRRSQTLAIITYGMAYYGPSQMLINIEAAAKAAGYDLIFSTVQEASLQQFESAVRSLAGWQVDGIIAITPVADAACEQFAALCAGTPMVQIDMRIGQQVPSVVIDQQHGARIITRHLIDLGHTAIAEISGPLNWYGAVARHLGWEQTIREAGCTPGPSLAGDWSAQSGYDAALKLIEQGATFTALVAGNDQMALGAIRALRMRGLRVPEDVSVTGFDNIPEAAFFEPSLTTIWQDFNLVGEKSVELLIARIENPDVPPEQRIIYPRLIVRESTSAR
jgi:LacI family transcriptional regulator